MSASTSNVSGTPERASRQGRRRARITLLLIFAVSVAPFVAAYLAYEFWQPSGRVNHGELIEPHRLPSGPLAQLDGRKFRLDDLRGKWVMIHAGSGRCGESCRKQLYYMRQVRLAQGKDRDRVERVWLITDS